MSRIETPVSDDWFFTDRYMYRPVDSGTEHYRRMACALVERDIRLKDLAAHTQSGIYLLVTVGQDVVTLVVVEKPARTPTTAPRAGYDNAAAFLMERDGTVRAIACDERRIALASTIVTRGQRRLTNQERIELMFNDSCAPLAIA